MARNTHSKLSMASAFHVPGSSRGDSNAIVPQLVRMVSRMNGSKYRDSTNMMALRRGS